MATLDELKAVINVYRNRTSKSEPQIKKRGFATYIHGKITDEGKYKFMLNLTKSSFACDNFLIEGDEMNTQELAIQNLKNKIDDFFDEVRNDMSEYEVKLSEDVDCK